ncbi:family 43 glycosylhydrolase [Hymenobacter sp.]|jgi:arabinan endo-1,5-alpha-L-arabinosidase|uniref:family 43 glycosylhydrolase n=1 Tax=Hymenobacter sp. TaxID=1898978 RepID=UPI002ED8E152
MHFSQRLGAAVLLVLLTLLAEPQAYALQGNDNCHDPSSIIKDGNRYWVFTTGKDIYAMYSTDMVNWQSGSRTVFNGSRPSWIAGRVPNFQGEYWAPECIYRNGKYYLYYSCSTFGSNVSAIGLATNVTLDPANPNYNWVDQGEVVSSGSGSAINAIDPAIVTDASGGLWMTYGSFFQGLGIIKLDGTTGKRSGTSFNWIAGNGGGSSGSEAPYIVRRGSYYYLFINKGACCRGSSSTYYIQVGRSTSVTGPYLDKSGVDLYRNGGTTLIATSGNYVGPGHAGLFVENGANYFTHHYYDSNQNGRARLSVSNLGWDGANWPFITRDWLPTGRYTLTNVSTAKSWDAWGCTGAQFQMVSQGDKTGANCQQFTFVPVGNGEYRINSVLGAGLSVEVAANNPNNGGKLQLNNYTGGASQKFKIERTNTGSYVLSSVNGNRVVEVPGCSATAGTQLALYDYLANNCQRWTIAPAAAARTALATTSASSSQISVYPNPTSGGQFTVALGEVASSGDVTVTLTDAVGRQVYKRTYARQRELPVETGLPAGLYMVRISSAQGIFTQKVDFH